MNIDRARALKIGGLVHFPADRGESSGEGRVTHIGEGAQSHPCVSGEFLWVTVERLGGKSRHVWPSNRLN